MEMKNASIELMLFNLNLIYANKVFYVINNADLYKPVDIKGPMQLIDENGDGYAWFTPLSEWNTYHLYPVRGIKKATDFPYKLTVFRDEPFVINLENK